MPEKYIRFFLGAYDLSAWHKKASIKKRGASFILGAAENHQIVGRGQSGSRTCEVAFRTEAGMAWCQTCWQIGWSFYSTTFSLDRNVALRKSGILPKYLPPLGTIGMCSQRILERIKIFTLASVANMLYVCAGWFCVSLTQAIVISERGNFSWENTSKWVGCKQPHQ